LCRIVLLAAAGRQDKEIAGVGNHGAHSKGEAGDSQNYAGRLAHATARWRQRFLAAPGLTKDARRPGRTPGISPVRRGLQFLGQSAGRWKL